MFQVPGPVSQQYDYSQRVNDKLGHIGACEQIENIKTHQLQLMLTICRLPIYEFASSKLDL